jgi:hypothetical protein
VLKNGEYPKANVDLMKFLKSNTGSTIKVNGIEKDINYYDALVLSVYWNSLNSVGAKYKFIFENYLSDQLQKDTQHFDLPQNRQQYEIAYI